MSTDEPRPTTASVDRRVERVEQQLAEQARDVAVLQTDMAHIRRLMESEFRTMAASQATTLAKLEVISALLHTREVEATRAMADPGATAAGRAVLALVNEGRERIAAMEKRVYGAAGAVVLLMFLLNLFAPDLRHLVGLP